MEKNKKILLKEQAREKLKKGIDQIATVVGSTLGPKGRNVIIEKEYGVPHLTKDGVTVAKSVKLKDPIENIGAQIVKEAASQTADVAGDGTTTATVLAQAIVTEGMKAVTMGVNPVELKRGIDKTVKIVTKHLKDISKDISDDKEIAQVATISANNDTEIGTIISTAIEKVGQDGVVTVEENKTSETKLETVEGMQFDRGYLSPYFITNNQNMQVILNEPYILLYDKKISTIKPLKNILEQIIAKNASLLIIADDVDGEALATLVVNKARGVINVCAVKAPEFGERKKEMLEDIAVLTGGIVISPDKGMKLENINIDQLGRAKVVTISNKQTTIVDGNGLEEEIIQRVEDIKKQIEKAESAYEVEKIQQRLAKMTSGVAIIYVGADSEVEMKEKKDRVEDALNATKAAIEEGIVQGGGMAFMKIYESLLKKKKTFKFENDDQLMGFQVIMKAIKAPFNVLMNNAGKNGDAVWISIKNKRKGYDIRNDKEVDMFKAGIIDPVKVTRVALEKAASVAGQFLLTDAVVSIEPEDCKDKCGNINYDEMYE